MNRKISIITSAICASMLLINPNAFAAEEPREYLGGGGGGGGGAAAAASSSLAPVAESSTAPRNSTQRFNELNQELNGPLTAPSDGTGEKTKARLSALCEMIRLTEDPSVNNFEIDRRRSIVKNLIVWRDMAQEMLKCRSKYEASVDEQTQLLNEERLKQMAENLCEYVETACFYNFWDSLKKKQQDSKPYTVIHRINTIMRLCIRDTMTDATKRYLKERQNILKDVIDIGMIDAVAKWEVNEWLEIMGPARKYLDYTKISVKARAITTCMDRIYLHYFDYYRTRDYAKRLLHHRISELVGVDVSDFMKLVEALQDERVRQEKKLKVADAERCCIDIFANLPINRVLSDPFISSWSLPAHDPEVIKLKLDIRDVWTRYLRLFSGENQDQSLMEDRERIARIIEPIIATIPHTEEGHSELAPSAIPAAVSSAEEPTKSSQQHEEPQTTPEQTSETTTES